MTANLQKGVTVKQAAQLMNVSERSAYMAAKIERMRPDLAEKCRAGELSLNKALQIATGKKPPTRYDKLIKAWNAASDDDRAHFLAEVLPDEVFE